MITKRRTVDGNAVTCGGRLEKEIGGDERHTRWFTKTGGWGLTLIEMPRCHAVEGVQKGAQPVQYHGGDRLTLHVEQGRHSQDDAAPPDNVGPKQVDVGDRHGDAGGKSAGSLATIWSSTRPPLRSCWSNTVVASAWLRGGGEMWGAQNGPTMYAVCVCGGW